MELELRKGDHLKVKLETRSTWVKVQETTGPRETHERVVQLSEPTSHDDVLLALLTEMERCIEEGYEASSLAVTFQDLAALGTKLDDVVARAETLEFRGSGEFENAEIELAALQRWIPTVSTLALSPEAASHLSSFERTPSLRTLRILFGGALDVEEAARIFPELRFLEVFDARVSAVEALGKLEKLESLLLWRLPGEPLSLSFVGELPALTDLRIYGGTEAIADADAVAKLTRLERLGLDRPVFEKAKRMGKLKRLIELNLRGAAIEDASFVTEMDALEELRLEDCGVKKLGASGMPVGLRVVSLRDNPIADVGTLARCSKLEALDLSSTAVKDLAPLAAIPALRFLTLEDLAPDPDGAAPLARNETLRVTFLGFEWSSEELVAMLRGEIRLPTMRELSLPAWSITTEDGDPGALGSSLAGTPYLQEGEGWPAAPDGTPMRLMVQLDLEKLPAPAGKGLFQLFYCADCDEPPRKLDPEKVLIRVVEPKGEPAKVELPAGQVKMVARTIARYWEGQDQPSSDDCFVRRVRAFRSRTIPGDKLMGWPAWVGSPAWPTGPDGEPMRLFLQLASMKGLRYSWGDGGTAFVFRSEKHPDHFDFLIQPS